VIDGGEKEDVERAAQASSGQRGKKKKEKENLHLPAVGNFQRGGPSALGRKRTFPLSLLFSFIVFWTEGRGKGGKDARATLQRGKRKSNPNHRAFALQPQKETG